MRNLRMVKERGRRVNVSMQMVKQIRLEILGSLSRMVRNRSPVVAYSRQLKGGTVVPPCDFQL